MGSAARIDVVISRKIIMTLNIRNNLLAYAGALIACLAILVWALELWRADLFVLFYYPYSGDIFFTGMFIKGSIDNPWFLHNDLLGMPFGLDFYDYPMFDNLHLGMMKLISLMTNDYASSYNLYYLLTYPLTTLTTLFVLRHFGLSFPAAIIGSLLYTFLPFHLTRAEGHIFLASYYLIPLMVMVILWIYLEHPIFIWDRTTRGESVDWSSSKAIASVVICFLVSSAGLYYAFFALFFLAVVGAIVAFKHLCLRPFFTAGFLAASICLGLVLNIAPNIFYWLQNGTNTSAVIRSALQAEVFGLRIVQLFLPNPWHRLPILAEWSKSYYQHLTEIASSLTNESMTASLGIAGSLGFTLLIGWLFIKRSDVATNDLIAGLSTLNIAAILLATIGGFGSLLAMISFSQIRAYNRISVYIAFFSLFAFVWGIEQIRKRWFHSKLPIFFGLLILFLAIFLLDQIPTVASPPYDTLYADYSNDAQFIRKIETLVSPGSAIFQLPAMTFPENGSLHQMLDYDLFRGYLHSKTLRWSYGAMKGRYAGDWQQQVVKKSLPEMVETLAFAGFEGIYIDRLGYTDSATELRQMLADILNVEPLISMNKRLLFFPMTPYVRDLQMRYTDAEWELQREVALHQPFVTWSGCSRIEGTKENNWRWCAALAELMIENPSNQTKHVDLEMVLATGYPELSELRIASEDALQTLAINSTETSVSKQLSIPHGKLIIKFASNARHVESLSDPRPMVFRIINFQLKDVKP